MSPSVHARVISVNLARVRPNPFKTTSITGIDKQPTLGCVHVRAPGTKADGLGSGLEECAYVKLYRSNGARLSALPRWIDTYN